MECLCFGWGSSCGLHSPRGQVGYKAESRIQKAVCSGNVAKVRRMLAGGQCGVNDSDDNNRTFLHYACAFGHPEVVTFLIQMECNINVCDSDNSTALIKAAQCQEEECARILLEHGADPNVKDTGDNSALHYAVYSKNTGMAASLILHNAIIETKNKEGLTPLLLALMENRQCMAKFLIENGANMHAVDNYGRTALMLAARHKSKTIISFLLQQGVEVLSEDCWGRTALSYAVDNGDNLKRIVLEYEEKRCRNSQNSISGERSRSLKAKHLNEFAKMRGEREILPKAHLAVITEEEPKQFDVSEIHQPEVEEQWMNHGSHEIETSGELCDGAATAADAFIQKRKNPKPDNQQFATKGKDEHDGDPAVHMKESQETEMEQLTPQQGVITPLSEKADPGADDLLQEKEDFSLSELQQEAARPPKKTSKKRKKVKKKRNAVHDTKESIGASETALTECKLHSPGSENILLLLDQLRMECKDSTLLLKIRDVLLAYESQRVIKESHCELCKEKNNISDLLKDLSDARELNLTLEYEKVQLETELFQVRSDFNEEQENRKHAENSYEKLLEELRHKQSEYDKQVETTQQLENSLATVNTELWTVQNYLNAVVEEKNDAQRKLCQEQDERNIVHEVLEHQLCYEKEVSMAIEKMNSQTQNYLQKTIEYREAALRDQMQNMQCQMSEVMSQLCFYQVEMEKFKQLYFEEVSTKISISDELNMIKERLEEVSAELLQEKRQKETLLANLASMPGQDHSITTFVVNNTCTITEGSVVLQHTQSLQLTTLTTVPSGEQYFEE